MESDDEFQQLISHGEDEPSSPIQKRKLKRLKRATSDHPNEETITRTVDLSPSNASNSNSDAPLESSEIPDLEESVDPFQPLFVYEGFGDRDEAANDREGAGSDGDRFGNERTLFEEEEGQDRSDPLDVGIDGSDGLGDDQMSDLGGKEGVFDANGVLDCGEKKGKKNKKKKGKSGGDGKSEVPGLSKRRIEKERKDNLRHLHIETQRLLRETRDASFKPVPMVQKPISSVLEKIRKRKLEISKKFGTSSNFYEIDHSSRDTTVNMCTEHVEINETNAEDMERDLDFAKQDEHLEGASIGKLDELASPSDECENASLDVLLKRQCKSTFRKPIDDTQLIFMFLLQELLCDSESVSEDDTQPDSPSFILLKSESCCRTCINFDLPLKIGDPVKAFVDDEAEEEDDSDNDPMLQDNDEDEENGDSEEFNDLIVSGYKEKPIDNEKRDELHQKWLEQQDAAATENVLQRIKCGLKQGEGMAFEEEDENEESDEDSIDGATADPLPKSSARLNSKKVKQMIPQMFNDKDDGFVSDDEEAEKSLARQLLIEKAEEHISFPSPSEDESSREVFGLIKKLNIVPDTKKKAKSSLNFSKRSYDKSSFLGRVSSNSLPASNKHGSSNFKSFIFGRDDSNSRSSVSEASPESEPIGLRMLTFVYLFFSNTYFSLSISFLKLPDERGSQPKKSATAKFSNSQSKANSQSKVASETTSGSSLLEILKRSSMKFDSKQTGIVGQTQSVIQFAAFKSKKSSMKMESRTL
ncbi:hypothetical protein Scep_000769 [Stephania cephalantha]|uniref:Uncharacterized protein n=1 Tax=Stephania cephalantha TaxID=152367 RepID=A0AAP0Q3B9_9MAGN